MFDIHSLWRAPSGTEPADCAVCENRRLGRGFYGHSNPRGAPKHSPSHQPLCSGGKRRWANGCKRGVDRPIRLDIPNNPTKMGVLGDSLPARHPNKRVLPLSQGTCRESLVRPRNAWSPCFRPDSGRRKFLRILLHEPALSQPPSPHAPSRGEARAAPRAFNDHGGALEQQHGPRRPSVFLRDHPFSAADVICHRNIRERHAYFRYNQQRWWLSSERTTHHHQWSAFQRQHGLASCGRRCDRWRQYRGPQALARPEPAHLGPRGHSIISKPPSLLADGQRMAACLR